MTLIDIANVKAALHDTYTHTLVKSASKPEQTLKLFG